MADIPEQFKMKDTPNRPGAKKASEIFRANGLSETVLIEAIQKGELDPRHLHFDNRLAVVAILRNSGRKNYEISAFLKTSLSTVEKYVRKIKNNQDHRVRNLTIEKVGGYLVYRAEELIQSAIKAGDLGLAWTIETELIDKLQSMGFIYKRPIIIEQTIDAKVENTVEFKKQNELFDTYNRAIFGDRLSSGNVN